MRQSRFECGIVRHLCRWGFGSRQAAPVARDSAEMRPAVELLALNWAHNPRGGLLRETYERQNKEAEVGSQARWVVHGSLESKLP